MLQNFLLEYKSFIIQRTLLKELATYATIYGLTYLFIIYYLLFIIFSY